jgi:hypothetical protein
LISVMNPSLINLHLATAYTADHAARRRFRKSR